MSTLALCVSKDDAKAIRDAACAMDCGRASLKKFLTIFAAQSKVDPDTCLMAEQDIEEMKYCIETLHLLANRLLGEMPD